MDRPLTLVGCFAHPDDDTWTISGSLALLTARGVRCALWNATRGEAGEIAPGSGATRATLAAVREAEERAAAATLGVHDVEFASFPDGAMDRADPAEVVRAIGAFLERWQPDVVVTMEPQGVTAHVDHIAVSSATKAAFAAYAAGRDPEPRLYYTGLPASRLLRFREAAQAAGVPFPDDDTAFALRGTPDEEFTCFVDTSEVAELRWRALQEHRTQASEFTQLAARGEEFWRRVFNTETYIRVHPAPRLGEPPEDSLVAAFQEVVRRD